MSSDLNRHSKKNRLTLGIVASLCAFCGLVAYLYEQGESYHWTSVQADETLASHATIDWAKVTENGEWLLWIDRERGIVSACNLKQSGSVKSFIAQSHLSIRPVTVVGDHLYILRSSMDRGFFETLRVGVTRLTRKSEFSSKADLADHPIGGSRTTHLEAIDLLSGDLSSRLKGGTGTIDEGEIQPIGFEMGRVSVSPDQGSLAWWWAEEETNGTPVSATVVETFQTFKLTGPTGFDTRKTLITPGYFQIWSGILSQIGTPLWLDPTTCVFLSFLDGGSLVPIDSDVGDFAATLTLRELFQSQDPDQWQSALLPEGVCSIPSDASKDSSLLFWRRTQEELQFLAFDSDFILSSTAGYEIGNLDATRPQWISDGRLLVSEREGGDYLALSGSEKKIQRFPAPPFTETEFEVLGIGTGEFLIALFDSKFWTAKEGADNWSELGLSP